jgi:RiboL-PSP-HEPN
MEDKIEDVQAKLQDAFQTIGKLKEYEDLRPFLKSFYNNLSRVIFLMDLYAQLKESKDFSTHKALEDILRASVVLIHATLEEFLRLLALKLLPNATEDVLNRIPLAGTRGRRAEKFFLGRLTEFKGRMIDEVIAKSVIENYENSTFNDTTDITNLLTDCGLGLSSVEGYLSDLDALMKRRHQIVHRVDRIDSLGSEERNIPDIKLNEVMTWMFQIWGFVISVLGEAHNNGLL